jgi:hypothetical protein
MSLWPRYHLDHLRITGRFYKFPNDVCITLTGKIMYALHIWIIGNVVLLLFPLEENKLNLREETTSE